ncbi:outer membrane protein assembly factor BamB family protein [Thiohalospira halophila]|nr:PQQ-binding-like beta-propeller repeat protein [Thiohalospira halophila]
MPAPLTFLLTTAGLLSALGGLTGCEDSDSSSEGNSAPTISDISAEGAPILPGGQVTVSVDSERTDGQSLDYDWFPPAGWSGPDSSTSSITLTAPKKQAAQGEVVTYACDEDERCAKAAIEIATRGPAIESFQVDPLPKEAGDTATFTVDAYNRDGRDLTYDYRIGGTLGASNQGEEWEWTAPEMAMGGRYLLEGIVTDSDDLTATASTETKFKSAAVWSTFGGNRQRTGQSQSADAEGAQDTIKWEYSTGDLVWSSPAVGPDGTVYVGSDDDHVYALNPDDGSEKWSFGTGGAVRSSPAIGADGTIYIGSYDNKVYALDPDTGDKEWSFETDNSVLASPAVSADGTVYIGSTDHHLYALDPESGDVEWKVETGDPIFSSPTQGADGTIYVGSDDGHLYALDPEDGQERWRFKTGDDVQSAPAIGPDGTVYFGSNDHNLYALDPEDGTEQWRFATGEGILSSPAVAADGTIYVGSSGGNFYAVDPDTGEEEWRHTTGNTNRSSPAIAADGTIYLGSNTSGLYALDPENRGEKWRVDQIGDVSFSSPAIGPDGTVYIGSWDKSIYAIE